jgi:hypothetical protein
MEESQGVPPNLGVFAYRCEITNLGDINLLNVVIPFEFWFQSASGGEQKGGEENAVKYEVVLSPIRAGASARFYAVNDCNIMATGILQNTARVRVSGMTKWQEVPLGRKFQNPIEQIMMFFPSRVRWIDRGECE